MLKKKKPVKKVVAKVSKKTRYKTVTIDDFGDDKFLTIARLAHEKDITFNKMCEKILREQMKKMKAKPSKTKQLLLG